VALRNKLLIFNHFYYNNYYRGFMEYPKLLWMITFDPKTPEKTFQERAVFTPFYEILAKPPISVGNDRQTFEFLSKINASLINITEAYLTIAESHKELKPKADEIRERLNVLNQWLQWIRSWLKPPEKEGDVD
jgi:hypothetical protein